jgi:hypothetical protein
LNGRLRSFDIVLENTMSTANLPPAVVAMLASPEMRIHHARWHYVRDRWNELPAAEQTQLESEGWKPPRLTGEPNAGIDFLYMHRRMIEHVNAMLATIGDPAYPSVAGWSPIPWNHADADWPMPPVYHPDVAWAKEQSLTDLFQARVANRYESNSWLAARTLDAVGSEIESGIHNWMHMHWSDAPWYTGAPGQDPDDVRNDYLGSTYSSHVNKAFWKLHGWIDGRIGQWAAASRTTADLSMGWEGPPHGHGPEAAMAPIRPLTRAEKTHAETKFRRPVRIPANGPA